MAAQEEEMSTTLQTPVPAVAPRASAPSAPRLPDPPLPGAGVNPSSSMIGPPAGVSLAGPPARPTPVPRATPIPRATPVPREILPQSSAPIGAAILARKSTSKLPWLLVVMLLMAVAALVAYIVMQ